MAKNAPDVPKINLFRGRGKNFIDKFISWAVSFGRALIMLTEIIALSAFIFRFGLDDQLTTLHSRIKQDDAYILFYKNEEKDFRNLQNLLQQEKLLLNSNQGTVQTLSDISIISVPGTTISNLTYSKGTLHIDAQATSVLSLASLIQTFKNKSSISDISVDKIENKTTAGIIDTSITLKVKGAQNAYQQQQP